MENAEAASRAGHVGRCVSKQARLGTNGIPRKIRLCRQDGGQGGQGPGLGHLDRPANMAARAEPRDRAVRSNNAGASHATAVIHLLFTSRNNRVLVPGVHLGYYRGLLTMYAADLGRATGSDQSRGRGQSRVWEAARRGGGGRGGTCTTGLNGYRVAGCARATSGTQRRPAMRATREWRSKSVRGDVAWQLTRGLRAALLLRL